MADSTVDLSATPATRAQLFLIVPLALERQCLHIVPGSEFEPLVNIFQSGQGAENARRAAHAALANGASALMSVGVAGALAGELDAGDVIVPSFVVDAHTGRQLPCSSAWTQDLRARIRSVCVAADGPLLSVSEVLTTPEEKRQAASRYGALACDLESAAIAAVAEEAGAHFSALRVISDTNDDKLPDGVADWVDDTGKARVLPVLSELKSPGRWRGVVTMVSRFHKAQRRLNQLSELLAAVAYCCPRS